MNDVMFLDTVKNWECCATVEDRDCFVFLLFKCILQKITCGFLLRSLLIHLVFNISLHLVKNNKLFLCYILKKTVLGVFWNHRKSFSGLHRFISTRIWTELPMN